MKLLFGAGVLILLFSLPTTAQSYGSYVGGGGSLNSGGSLTHASGMRGPAFHPPQSSPETRFPMTVTFGSESEFIPSVYVPFQEAVAQGRAALTAKPKTLAEVALENRAAKKAKAELAFVQDDNGKAVTQPQ